MDQLQKQALRLALKDKPSDAGIFAFRHAASATAWVGQSKTLNSIEARLRFTLRTGGLAPAALRAAWAQEDGNGFAFEVLERLDPDLSPINLADTLKARAAHWRQSLGAQAL